MNQAIQRSSFNLWHVLLHAVFLLSGFSGLVYQVVWMREFGLIFGVTSYAVGAVLSAFFAGLALGSWLTSRWSSRHARNPLRLYSLLELGIGLYALAIPILLSALNALYAAIFPSMEQSFYLLSLARFAASVLVLIVPTTLMGATLPLVTQALAQRIENVTVNVSGLYAINTLGALIGAAFSGFYAIGELGVFGTTLLAVGGNAAAAIGALIVAGHLSTPSPSAGTQTQPAAPTDNRRYRIALLTGLFLSGFAALGYEVVWTRMLSLFLGLTVVAFTTILCSVLMGIVIGGWLLRISAARLRRPMRALALIESSVAVLSLLSMVLLAQAVPSRASMGFALLLGTILVLPNALLGMTLPLAVHIYQEHVRNVGESVGKLYSANVLGGVFGSFATSFVLLPLIGSQQTLLFLVMTNVCIAVLFFRHSESAAPRRALVWGNAAAIAVAFFLIQPQFLFAGVKQAVYGNQQLLLHEEDLEGIVAVTQQGSARAIYFNGMLESDDLPELLVTHRRLAHLPLLLHPHPEDVLIVGLGSGTTAGAVTRHSVKQLRILELVPSMIKGAELFERSNYALLKDPRVDLQIGDGRNYLLLAQNRFDVIEADVIRPFRAGANNLYAAEYYRLVSEHLKPGGIVCQWLDTSLPEEHYKMLLRTFVQVFPNTTLWEGGMYAVAMPDGIKIDEQLIRARFQDPNLAEALKQGGYPGAEALLHSFTMGPEDIRSYIGTGPTLSDDHPYLEYLTSPLYKSAFQLPQSSIQPFLSKPPNLTSTDAGAH